MQSVDALSPEEKARMGLDTPIPAPFQLDDESAWGSAPPPREPVNPVEDPDYHDVGDEVRVDHPQVEGAFISVLICPYGTGLERARFIRSCRDIKKDHKGRDVPAPSTYTVANATGLFLFDMEQACRGFAYPKKNKELVTYDEHNAGRRRDSFLNFPGWFGRWAQKQIVALNSWDKDEEDDEDRFRR